MSFTEDRYNNLVKQTEDFINRTEDFIDECQQVLADFYNTDFQGSLNIQDETFKYFIERLRWRIKTGLINIAVTGEFSSGKSFFIAGLINKLKWRSKPDPRIRNKFDDKYDSLLPASTEQTTSCPLEVCPTLDTQSESWFEVVFSDEPNKWVRINLELDLYKDTDKELHRLLLGYVTTLDHTENNRREEHLNKHVIKARLHISGMKIPAVIHDLPGLGGIDINGEQKFYRQAFEDAIQGADCIFYLSSAEKVLGDNELQMLRYIEGIWRAKRIPVFFILTKVDKESNSDVNNIKYRNRQYFNTYFSSATDHATDHTESDFLGEGFIAVSAAWEAKALGQFQANQFDLKIDSETRDNLIEASGMPQLRKKIDDHLKVYSGPSNMSSIAIELGNILLATERSLSGYLTVESEPIENINEALSQLTDEHRKLEAFKDKIAKDLDRRAASCRKMAFKGSLNYQLKDKLLTGLRPLIENLDVLKADTKHNIKREQGRLIQEWIEMPDGLHVQITEAFRRFREDTSIFLNSNTDSDLKNAILKGRAKLILEPDPANLPTRPPKPPPDTEGSSNVIMSGIGILTGMVGVTGGSLVTALSLAGPALVLLTPMSLGLFALRVRNKKIEREDYRKELIDSIPITANRTIEAIKKKFDDDIISPYIGLVIDLVDESSAENANKIRAYQKRLANDLKTNVIRTEKLRKLLSNYTQLNKQITLFVRTAIEAAD